MWISPNFSGEWILEKDKSDSMDPLFVLMGMSWLVRKVANAVDMYTVIEHEPSNSNVTTTDKTGNTVLSSTSMISDGVEVEKLGSDNRLAKITCSVFPLAYSESPDVCTVPLLQKEFKSLKDVLGCLRIITELPDGVGVTDCTFILIENGKRIRQVLTFTKGEKVAVAHRWMQNRLFKNTVSPGRFVEEVDEKSEVDISADNASIVEDNESVVSTPRQSFAESPQPSLSRSNSLMLKSSSSETQESIAQHLLQTPVSAVLPDPFFVSLSGEWKVDRKYSPSLSNLWKSLRVGLLTRTIAGRVEIVNSLTHQPLIFGASDSSALGMHKSILPLDGEWHPVKQPNKRWMLMRVTQSHGHSDRGSTWLGYECGMIPQALLDVREAAEKIPIQHPASPLPTSRSTAEDQGFSAASDARFRNSRPSSIEVLGGPHVRDDPLYAEGSTAPYYSAQPFEPLRYSTATIIVETLLLDITDAVHSLRSKFERNPSSFASVSGSASNSASAEPSSASEEQILVSSEFSITSPTALAAPAAVLPAAQRDSKWNILTPELKARAVELAIQRGLPRWQAQPWPQVPPAAEKLSVSYSLQTPSHILQRYTHLSATGGVLVSVEQVLRRSGFRGDFMEEKKRFSREFESMESLVWSDANPKEKGRLAHVRAVLLTRRAEADHLRRVLSEMDFEKRNASNDGESIRDGKMESNKEEITSPAGKATLGNDKGTEVKWERPNKTKRDSFMIPKSTPGQQPAPAISAPPISQTSISNVDKHIATVSHDNTVTAAGDSKNRPHIESGSKSSSSSSLSNTKSPEIVNSTIIATPEQKVTVVNPAIKVSSPPSVATPTSSSALKIVHKDVKYMEDNSDHQMDKYFKSVFSDGFDATADKELVSALAALDPFKKIPRGSENSEIPAPDPKSEFPEIEVESSCTIM